jgi:thymidylate synthase (FAD)
MAHCVISEAEEILDKEYPVLDKGFVRLVDYLGGDARIVQAARVSYGAGTKTVREDAALIDYLLRNEHSSPFEQVVFTFHLKMPIFVARQWTRHRTARMNEISGRYSVLQNECYIPAPEDVARQSADNKQGRESQAVSALAAQKTRMLLKQGQEEAYAAYEELINAGLARELARINLPLSLYTEMYWQIDLRNLFHFLKLRLDAHAQKEIRDYAAALFEIVKKVAPLAASSFENHILNAVRFSGEEMRFIRARLGDEAASPAGDSRPGAALEGKLKERFEAKLHSGKQL